MFLSLFEITAIPHRKDISFSMLRTTSWRQKIDVPEHLTFTLVCKIFKGGISGSLLYIYDKKSITFLALYTITHITSTHISLVTWYNTFNFTVVSNHSNQLFKKRFCALGTWIPMKSSVFCIGRERHIFSCGCGYFPVQWGSLAYIRYTFIYV